MDGGAFVGRELRRLSAHARLIQVSMRRRSVDGALRIKPETPAEGIHRSANLE